MISLSMKISSHWLRCLAKLFGFLHLILSRDIIKYLGFSFVWPDGRVRYFIFNVLPFGLSSACYLFTKMFRPLVRRWREFGQPALMYIDDGISGDACKQVAVNYSATIQRDLNHSGWKPSDHKCQWEPLQIGEWLGLLINTVRMQFQIPIKKLNKAFVQIEFNLSSFPKVSVLKLAKLCGFLNSLSLAMGPVVRLFTRNMYACIAASSSWNDVVLANAGVKDELKFWLNNIHHFNGYSIIRSFTAHAVITQCLN